MKETIRIVATITRHDEDDSENDGHEGVILIAPVNLPRAVMDTDTTEITNILNETCKTICRYMEMGIPLPSEFVPRPSRD